MLWMDFFILEILITNTSLFSIFLFFHHKQHLNSLTFYIQILFTLLILTLSQPQMISNTLRNSKDWIKNINKLSNNSNPPNEITYPHVIFSFERKDYTIAELLTVFSADFLDLIYLHNVIPPESPCAAVRVSVPTLNF